MPKIKSVLMSPVAVAGPYCLLIVLHVLALAYALDRMPRQFRYSIRSLLVTTFLVAVACGTFMSMHQWAVRVAQAG